MNGTHRDSQRLIPCCQPLPKDRLTTVDQPRPSGHDPCHPAVIEAMEPWWREQWGNACRQHRLGLTAAAAVSSARKGLADSLGVESDAVIFTSGATEANNLALLGHARFRARAEGGPGHLISVASEHHAVLDPLQQLRQEGFELTLLTPRPDGLIETTQLEQAIQANTQLVSVMVANNEIGVIQPVQELSTICRNHGITMHTDAAQAYGHLALNMPRLGCSLLSISAHKFNGPKGIGALVARKGTGLDPLLWGGGQEQGLRPGTLPVPLIMGLAAAATLATADRAVRQTRLGALRDQLWHDLKQRNLVSCSTGAAPTPGPQPQHHRARNLREPPTAALLNWPAAVARPAAGGNLPMSCARSGAIAEKRTPRCD